MCSLKTLRSFFKSVTTALISLIKRVVVWFSKLLIVVCSGSVVDSICIKIFVHTDDLKNELFVLYFVYMSMVRNVLRKNIKQILKRRNWVQMANYRPQPQQGTVHEPFMFCVKLKTVDHYVF